VRSWNVASANRHRSARRADLLISDTHGRVVLLRPARDPVLARPSTTRISTASVSSAPLRFPWTSAPLPPPVTGPAHVAEGRVREHDVPSSDRQRGDREALPANSAGNSDSNSIGGRGWLRGSVGGSPLDYVHRGVHCRIGDDVVLLPATWLIMTAGRNCAWPNHGWSNELPVAREVR